MATGVAVDAATVDVVGAIVAAVVDAAVSVVSWTDRGDGRGEWGRCSNHNNATGQSITHPVLSQECEEAAPVS